MANPRLERWLTRLGALSSSEWGRLDAAAAPLGGRGPRAMLARAQLLGQLMRAVDFPGISTFGLVAGLGLDLGRQIVAPRPTGSAPDTGAHVPDADEAYHRMQHARLLQLAQAAPGQAAKAHASTRHGVQVALHFAYHGVLFADVLPGDALRRLYAPVEGVIPLASIANAPDAAWPGALTAG